MSITRRTFIGTGAAGAIAALDPFARAVRAFARQEPLVLTPPDKPRHDLVEGQNPLAIHNDRDGVIYIPKGYRRDVPMPLVVALHGAGGSGANAGFAFRQADEFGYIVLAPDSRDWTWDSILGHGQDTEFLAAAFQSTIERCAVDRRRLALAGFSDGATHVMSFGIANGDVFGHLMAFSPGLMRPPGAKGKPRIFISHGTADQTMPIDVTSRRFVPRLKALGYDVTYREFEGKHTLPPDIAHDAYAWFMKGSLVAGG
ncbi:MAG: phospholipase [Acidobacteria bacterium]|nr:phospholipase [Acidobacteriota bacterium]